MMKNYNFRMPDKLKEELIKLAKEEDRTVGAMVRRILSLFIKERKEVEDFLKPGKDMK